MSLHEEIEMLEARKQRLHTEATADFERSSLAYLVARDVAENWPKIEQERRDRA